MTSSRPPLPPAAEGAADKVEQAGTATVSAASGGIRAKLEAAKETAARGANKATRVAGSAHPGSSANTRSAVLRLTHVDPWSVTKMAAMLSVVLGIVSVVAVTLIWGVLGAAGVWDSINNMLGNTLGGEQSSFDITNYVGAGRVIGFTLLASVLNTILLTALATLGAFIYNLAATLLGGFEVTLTEDR